MNSQNSRNQFKDKLASQVQTWSHKEQDMKNHRTL